MGVTIKKTAKIPNPTGVDHEIATAVGKTVTTSPDGSTKEALEQAAVAYGPGPFANVGVQGSRTFNLGDYNSAKIEVSLHVPCVPTKPEINEAFAFATEWVNDKMDKMIHEIEQSQKKG